MASTKQEGLATLAECEKKISVTECLNASITKDRRPGIPYLKEVIQHLIDEYGGPREFARAFHDVYHLSDSSMVKARMLESILRLLQTEANIDPGSADLGILSEEDLQAAALTLLQPYAAPEEEDPVS